MRLTRRAALAAPAAALAGCAPDPTIQTERTAAPPRPTVAPFSLEVAAGVLAVQRELRGQDEAATKLADALEAHLNRLLATNPLSDEPRRVADPPQPAAAKDVLGAAEETRKAADRAIKESDDQPLRLLYTSVAAAVRAAENPARAGGEGGKPGVFSDVSEDDAVQVAFSRTLALINGYELGLGRLAKDDPLLTATTPHLDRARQLRTELRSRSAQPTQAVAYDLPEPMQTPEQIRAAWAQLELACVDALGAVLAATGETVWLQRMLEWVPVAQAHGGTVALWPGWTRA